MEVYVISKYGYCMGGVHEVVGIFQNKGEAKKCYLDIIKEYEEKDFVIDEECNKTPLNYTTNHTRLFGDGYQENWDKYIEIYIEKMEVK